MLALTMPMSEPAHLNRLTLSMHEKMHPLLKPVHNMEVVLRSPSFAGGWFVRHLIQGKSRLEPPYMSEANSTRGY
jgi:hypothetical protein